MDQKKAINDKQKEKRKQLKSIAIGAAQDQQVQKHGEAVSQILQAYKGKRYDSAGHDLGHKGRSLKKISTYSKGNNPDLEQRVIKSQAGFSGELIKEARDNKTAILNGETTRTRTTDGLGQTNHTQYDHVKVDMDGNVITGSGSQMKIYGLDKMGRPKVIENLVKKRDWDRYDLPIDIPAEQHGPAVKYAKEQAEKCREQAKKLLEIGKIEEAAKKNELAVRYDEAGERVRKSNVTTKEAVAARLNPKTFTAKEVLKDSHNAGIEGAKGTMLFSAIFSSAQNTYGVMTGDADVEEAAKTVIKDVVNSGIISYGNAAMGTTIKACMHSSGSIAIRKLGTGNLPTVIATGVYESSRSVIRYARGEINELELIQELGEKGTGIVAGGFGMAVGGIAGGAIGSVFGTVALPGGGTVAGAAVGASIGVTVGGMLAYIVSDILYIGAVEALKEADIAAERRAILEVFAQQAIDENMKYQKALLQYASEQYQRREDAITAELKNINNSIYNNNIDAFITSMNQIGTIFGIKMQFDSFEEIDVFMQDKNTKFIL